MSADQTTAAVQRYLDVLNLMAVDATPDWVIQELVGRAVNRLRLLCNSMLIKSYPRLLRAPFNLEVDEMLGSIAQRLLRALREVRPTNVRQFFALANQHMRWELNDMARRLDKEAAVTRLNEAVLASPASSGSPLSQNALRILEAIDNLPKEEREAFDLIRIQSLTQPEAAVILGVSEATLKRRLKRGIVLLMEQLNDLEPADSPRETER